MKITPSTHKILITIVICGLASMALYACSSDSSTEETGDLEVRLDVEVPGKEALGCARGIICRKLR